MRRGLPGSGFAATSGRTSFGGAKHRLQRWI
jgi:hypothetical protein